MEDARIRFSDSALSRCAGALWLACTLVLAQVTIAGELSPYMAQDSAAPAFNLKALDGKAHRLADYRGKVVLVNFWATWCPPCLAELPSMQRLADQMAPEAFEILAINVEESPFRVSKFVKLIGLRLSVLLDDKGETFQAWGGSVYPTSFVLDREGRVRHVAYGPLEWDDEDVVKTLSGLLPPGRPPPSKPTAAP
jgi:thiol-disulfide isomerase/thioredoxin